MDQIQSLYQKTFTINQHITLKQDTHSQEAKEKTSTYVQENQDTHILYSEEKTSTHAQMPTIVK